MSKRVVICGKHLPDGYSGGRYHAWIMAEALTAAGHDVTVWTNHSPYLARDFVDYPAHERIRVVVSSDFAPPEVGCDCLILVPDTSRPFTMYAQALLYAQRMDCRVALLNFESPNWFNAYSPKPRPEEQWDHWVTTSRYCDLILSSAAESQKWAEQFYTEAPAAAQFRYCYPAINTLVADRVPEQSREDRLVCITRLYGAHLHKGGRSLVDAISEQLRGWELVLLIGTGRIDADLREPLTAKAEQCGVRLTFQERLSDREKFELLKSSRGMLFLSHFEGYGYPPVESIYCGTPCLAFGLPVLREVSGDALHYVAQENRAQIAPAVANLIRTPMPQGVPGHVRQAASFERYVREMDTIIEEVVDGAEPAAIRGLSAEVKSELEAAVGPRAGLVRLAAPQPSSRPKAYLARLRERIVDRVRRW